MRGSLRAKPLINLIQTSKNLFKTFVLNEYDGYPYH